MLHANDLPPLKLRALALTIALALSGAVHAGPLPLPASETTPAADPALEAALLAATNAARTSHGLAALRPDEGLARAAREHAAEMAKLQYFSHGSPIAAHASLADRLSLAGSPLADVAENIVMLGRPGDIPTAAQQAVTAWLNSPPHRANLLGPYDVVGFGTARDSEGRLFVVQDFGRAPAQLLAYTLVHATRETTAVKLGVHAASATEAFFRLGDDAPVTMSLPAGDSTVTLTTVAQGSVSVVVGAPRGGNDYVEDDAGTIELSSGRYLPDVGQPRVLLSIRGATADSRREQGARLTLRYAPLSDPSLSLSLFLGGAQQPQARTAVGTFELFLPTALGVASISVGVDGPTRSVAIFQRFHVDVRQSTPRLAAGPAP